MIQPKRRGFLIGAGALLMAPAIVRASSIMPVSVLSPEPEPLTLNSHGLMAGDMIILWVGNNSQFNGTYTVIEATTGRQLIIPA